MHPAPHIPHTELIALLRAAKTMERTFFTHALNDFEKKYEVKYGAMHPDAADTLFLGCKVILEDSRSTALQVESALRLLRVIVMTKECMNRRMSEFFALCMRFLDHADGNVRNAVIGLLDRYRFGFDCLFFEKSTGAEEHERMFLDQYLHMIYRESLFLTHHPHIARAESRRKNLSMAQDTKDPILKSLRRAIEEFGFGLMIEKLAEKYGVQLPYSFNLDLTDTFPDAMHHKEKPSALLQLKIQAKDIRPSIYRTIIVPDTATFYDLHVYIQDVFDLHDYHLFSFEVPIPGSAQLSYIEAPYAEPDPWGDTNRSATETPVREVLNGMRKRCGYWYDFGDDWKFTVELQKVLPVDAIDPKFLPHLLKAQGPNLLEDCRGNWGFSDLLDMYAALQAGKKPTKKMMEELEWRGFEEAEDFRTTMEERHDIQWEEFSFSDPRKRLETINAMREE